MSTITNKRRRSVDETNRDDARKRDVNQEESRGNRHVGPGIEFEVLQAYRDFEEVINQDRVQMSRTGDIQIAIDSLDKVDTLYKKVEGTKNNGLFAHDARAMVCISELAEMSVRNFKFDDAKSLVNLGDILNSLKKYMLTEYFTKNEIAEALHTNNFLDQASTEEGHMSDNEENAENGNLEHLKESIRRRDHLQQFGRYSDFEQFNWLKMGALYEKVSKIPKSVDHLVGPLSLVRKPRAAVARREHDAVSEVITAEKVSQNSLSTSQETTTPEHVRRCFKILSKKKGAETVNLFEFIIDPKSFAKSVENLFYTSFLIKEGRIILEKDKEGLPSIRIKESLPSDPREKGIELQKRRDAQQNHIIFQLDMQTWTRFIEKFDIKEAFLQ